MDNGFAESGPPITNRLLDFGQNLATIAAQEALLGREAATELAYRRDMNRTNALNGSGAPDPNGFAGLPRSLTEFVWGNPLDRSQRRVAGFNPLFLIMILGAVLAFLIIKRKI